MYCGELGSSDGDSDTTIRKKSNAARQVWIRTIIKTVVLIALLGLGGYLVFTDAGKQVAQNIINLFRSDKEYSEVVEFLIEEVPAVGELEERPGSVQFNEEHINEGEYAVTVMHQDGADFMQARFSVDIFKEEVIPLNAPAEELMYGE